MSAITERDLKKAAKIWGYCLIIKTDCSQEPIEFSNEIREFACDYAKSQLTKLGVIYPYEIQSETHALKFVLSQKRFTK